MATIWITGGKGFIGRHLARLVSGEGNQVYGIGHGAWPAGEAGTWGYVDWCNGEIETVNLSRLAKISGLPDIVCNLAGGSSVSISLQDPREDFCRSVESISRLLEWLRRNAPDARVVSASSAAVYGIASMRPITESAAITPYSPYGLHKAMMESLCRSYAKNFGLHIAIVRMFSVYGARLEKQLVWDLCGKLAVAGNDPVVLSGTGREVRDWLHVSDAAAMLWLARQLCDRECFTINGGTGIATSIHDLASLVCKEWGGGAAVEFSGIARVGDPPCQVADCAKGIQSGFNPEVMLPEGIREAVNWYKEEK